LEERNKQRTRRGTDSSRRRGKVRVGGEWQKAEGGDQSKT